MANTVLHAANPLMEELSRNTFFLNQKILKFLRYLHIIYKEISKDTPNLHAKEPLFNNFPPQVSCTDEYGA